MSEHPLDRLTKKLVLILLLLLSPFAVLIVFAFYKKYEQAANTIIVGIAIIVAICFIINYTHFNPQKQQARVDYLNRILGRYGRRSPAPPRTPHYFGRGLFSHHGENGAANRCQCCGLGTKQVY